MESLTANKPKALVPIDNLPMIFHLFRKYPDKKFIVIGDYKYDVLERYLREFAEVDYTMVCGTGHTGTCSGLKEAISYIPDNERFMLIWCDLVLPKDYEIQKVIIILLEFLKISLVVGNAKMENLQKREVRNSVLLDISFLIINRILKTCRTR